MLFTKLCLETLVGWEKGEVVSECRDTSVCVNKGADVSLQSNQERLLAEGLEDSHHSPKAFAVSQKQKSSLTQ